LLAAISSESWSIVFSLELDVLLPRTNGGVRCQPVIVVVTIIRDEDSLHVLSLTWLTRPLNLYALELSGNRFCILSLRHASLVAPPRVRIINKPHVSIRANATSPAAFCSSQAFTPCHRVTLPSCGSEKAEMCIGAGDGFPAIIIISPSRRVEESPGIDRPGLSSLANLIAATWSASFC
jgi:hypothetical protein